MADQTKVTSVTRVKMLEEAARRGWKVDYIDPRRYFYRITNQAGKSCIFHGSIPQTSSWIGSYIATHKLQSMDYLEAKGIIITPYMVYDNEQSARDFMRQHAPIVVKPEDSEQSKGVTVDVTTVQQLQKAVQFAQQHSTQVVLQKQLSGKLYRLLVIGGKFFAASCRYAAFVVGDGVSTVAELVAEKNAHPWRGTDSTAILKKIDVRAVAEYLGGEDWLHEVLAPNQQLKISAVDSVSAGGEAADVTDEVHASYIKIVESIAQELDIVSCGFDIMTQDISQPVPSELPFLEMNSMPGFKMHYYPSAGGKPRNVAKELLDVTLGKA